MEQTKTAHAIRVTRDMGVMLRGISILGLSTLKARLNIMTDDGRIVPFDVHLGLPTYLTTYSKVEKLIDGWLVSAAVTCTNPSSNVTGLYAQLFITSAGSGISDISHVLVSNYVTPTVPVAWPVSQPVGYLEAIPGIFTQQLANPAAGAQFTLDVPTNMAYRFVCLKFKLSTSLTAGIRIVSIQFKAGSDVVYVCHNPYEHIEDETTTYFVSAAPARESISQYGAQQITCPPNLFLDDSMHIVSATTNMDSEDQFYDIILLAQNYLIPR